MTDPRNIVDDPEFVRGYEMGRVWALLQELPGKPPYRIAGIPSGIISEDDLDVTDEALELLAALAALAALDGKDRQ